MEPEEKLRGQVSEFILETEVTTEAEAEANRNKLVKFVSKLTILQLIVGIGLIKILNPNLKSNQGQSLTYLTAQEASSKGRWYLDSSATNHATNDLGSYP